MAEPELGWSRGDVVAYRCSDCLDRWDLVVDADGPRRLATARRWLHRTPARRLQSSFDRLPSSLAATIGSSSVRCRSVRSLRLSNRVSSLNTSTSKRPRLLEEERGLANDLAGEHDTHDVTVVAHLERTREDHEHVASGAAFLHEPIALGAGDDVAAPDAAGDLVAREAGEDRPGSPSISATTAATYSSASIAIGLVIAPVPSSTCWTLDGRPGPPCTPSRDSIPCGNETSGNK